MKILQSSLQKDSSAIATLQESSASESAPNHTNTSNFVIDEDPIVFKLHSDPSSEEDSDEEQENESYLKVKIEIED